MLEEEVSETASSDGRHAVTTVYHTAQDSQSSSPPDSTDTNAQTDEDGETVKFPTGKGRRRGEDKGKGPLSSKFTRKPRTPTQTKGTKYLSKGASFGLKSLLYCTPAECSAKAIDHVDLFCFTSAEFVDVLKDFPGVVEDIELTAAKEYGRPLKLL